MLTTFIRTGYRDQVDDLGNEVAECKTRIGNFDTALQGLSSSIEQLTKPSELPLPTSTNNIEQLQALREPLNQIANCRQSRVWQSEAPDLIPADNWGPFGTRWLLRTGSRDLTTLIAGMLGFGLLGETISTAVRKGALLDYKDQTVASDLAGVVIRGFSAAIIVFLAAMGGLAIVAASGANQSTEPNPYVLFLTGFVAAVYSEDLLWLGARRRFREKAGLPADEPKIQPRPPGSDRPLKTPRSKSKSSGSGTIEIYCISYCLLRR